MCAAMTGQLHILPIFSWGVSLLALTHSIKHGDEVESPEAGEIFRVRARDVGGCHQHQAECQHEIEHAGGCNGAHNCPWNVVDVFHLQPAHHTAKLQQHKQHVSRKCTEQAGRGGPRSSKGSGPAVDMKRTQGKQHAAACGWLDGAVLVNQAALATGKWRTNNQAAHPIQAANTPTSSAAIPSASKPT